MPDPAPQNPPPLIPAWRIYLIIALSGSINALLAYLFWP
jgi:hypothetical protein